MSDATNVQTKICPRCAETIKEAALACHYCGYEFSASAPAPSAPYAPQPPVYAAPSPAYPPVGYAQTPMYVQPAPIDPRLSTAIASYGKRQYKVVTGAGGSVTMERPATKFGWLWMIMLVFLFGVGALVYLLAWTIWGVHKTYRVVLSVGPQGEVQEMGDDLAVFDRDHLKAHRLRCNGFGILLVAFAALVVVGTVGSILAPASGTEPMTWGTAAIGLFVFAVIPAAGAALLFRAARRAARVLGVSPPLAASNSGPSKMAA